MKHSKPNKSETPREPMTRFRDFVQFAALLSVSALVFVMLFAGANLFRSGETWLIAVIITLVPIWVGTMAVACLVCIPPAIWRSIRRRLGWLPKQPGEAGELWDGELDGPAPPSRNQP